METATLSLFLYLSQLLSIFSHLSVLSTSVCFCCGDENGHVKLDPDWNQSEKEEFTEETCGSQLLWKRMFRRSNHSPSPPQSRRMAARSHWGEKEREEGSDSDGSTKHTSSHTNRKKHFNFCLSAVPQPCRSSQCAFISAQRREASSDGSDAAGNPSRLICR